MSLSQFATFLSDGWLRRQWCGERTPSSQMCKATLCIVAMYIIHFVQQSDLAAFRCRYG